ncbi:MAG: carbamoyltransferase HypF, partial [Planctomycetota bacterium]
MRPHSGLAVRVAGIVQGVGFRPFVHRLATEIGLSGEVRNDAQGVRIRVFGSDAACSRFLVRLQADAPPLARIDAVTAEPATDPHPPADFRIDLSGSGGERLVPVTPDAAICADCRRELLDPSDRRYRYPFINCTNCGPRYTIVEDVPYDRAKTTMRAFAMCDACRAEYEAPADRRFHAQPNCCAACGPRVWLAAPDGTELPGEPFPAAAELLAGGMILALKGLGGFHLACDATNEEAVRRLRDRKGRDEKPFAVMLPDAATARELVRMPQGALDLLAGPESPIVIARKRSAAGRLAPSVAPTNAYLGVLLPYTPLHILLFDEGLGPLVMTSGNLSDEPIAIDNAEALDRLGGIADAFLLHDRPIDQRCDDSVVLHTTDHPVLLRRARGYVPAGIETGLDVHGILAVGPLLKNAPALGRKTTAYPGQHVGDMDHPAAVAMFEGVRDRLQRLLDVEPVCVACDLHPDYPTTRAAEASGLPVVRVQHHHAHIVSVMAETQCHEPAIGFAYDGTGYGPDGTVWGGEALIVTPAAFRRAFHLQTVPQPGGDAAAREPWRMAVAHLWSAGLDPARWIDEARVGQVVALLESPLPHPWTSSMGRLFDAVSALAGF